MKPKILRIRTAPAALMALLLPTPALAQVPTQCLEIESILVDACIDLQQCPGASEGQNEMVRFRTGPVAIALNELEADWPNNSWNGLVQDATTAGLTATLNATIQGCGWLLEPPGGIIPPGSQVLLVTSTNMCTEANSFANLSDTLYIVFQAPGNTSGHFANHNNGAAIGPTPTGASSLRTLVLTYLPTACSDTAIYDRAQLVNIYGTYGGSAAENDGSTAVFSWPGPAVVSYVNYGCQAPFVPTLVSVDDAVGSICNGTGSVQLTGSAVGTDIVSVQWQGGTGTFNPPDALNTVYTAGAGDTGPVVVQLCAIGSCGAPICVDFTLPGGSAPLVAITPDGPTAICPGQSVTLTASGADSYVWNTTETTAAITVSQPGTYSVQGTNACGSGSAQIEVTQSSGPQVVITADGPTAICPGQSVTLTASGADSYVWNTTETTAAITVSQPGTYSVQGTNACGSGSAQIEVTQSSGPQVVITADGPTAICPGQSVTLTASGADSYVWSTTETTAAITVSQAGTYTVLGTNACGSGSAQIEVTQSSGPQVVITADGPTAICPGQSMTLTASGADSYVWNTTETTAAITVSQPGTYSVQGTNACGSGSAQIEVTQSSGPQVVITADGPTAICPGQSVTLTASGADSYVWNTTETTAAITVSQPGTYSVQGTNACGSGSAQIEVTQSSGPQVVITADGPTAICPGQSVTLTASGADSYVWNTTETTAAITVSQPGTYSVQGTNACGSGSAQIEVTQSSGPQVVITADGPTAICPGQSVTLTASGADSYLWSTMETTAAITVSQAGTYTVLGTNGCGSASAQATVTVVPVSAAFTATPLTGNAPLEVGFTNGSAPATGSMSWQFGDGDGSTDNDPTQVYDSPGTYTVTLTVTSQGCTASATATITVRDASGPSSIMVPNVFTPNADGVNDQFRVDAQGIERIEVLIFNRYGQEVARLVRPRQAWDGRTFAGEMASDGTYFYVIEALGFDGQKHSLKGAVTLLR